MFQFPLVKAKAVITADIRVIGGKTRNLKEKIARALSSVDTSVQFVLVAKRNDISSEVNCSYGCKHCIEFVV